MTDLRNVSVSESLELLADGALLLDVREDNEWEAGRAPQAIHISLGSLPDHVNEIPRNRLIVCVCRSGARSSRAAQYLAEQGSDVANLDGGMLAWASQGEQLVADAADPAVI